MITYDTPAAHDAEALDAMARETWLQTFGQGYTPADLDA